MLSKYDIQKLNDLKIESGADAPGTATAIQKTLLMFSMSMSISSRNQVILTIKDPPLKHKLLTFLIRLPQLFVKRAEFI